MIPVQLDPKKPASPAPQFPAPASSVPVPLPSPVQLVQDTRGLSQPPDSSLILPDAQQPDQQQPTSKQDAADEVSNLL